MLRADLPDDIHEPTDLGSLTGYTVVDTHRGAIGTITAIDTSTLNTLVELDSGILLPLHEDLIEAVDTARHLLTVHLPEGLIAEC